MAKKQKVYQINGSTEFDNLITKLKHSKNTQTYAQMKGFLEDNNGVFLTEDRARDAYLAACVKYGKSVSVNVAGIRGKGFGMNVPWVAKRCSAVKIYIQQ